MLPRCQQLSRKLTSTISEATAQHGGIADRFLKCCRHLHVSSPGRSGQHGLTRRPLHTQTRNSRLCVRHPWSP